MDEQEEKKEAAPKVGNIQINKDGKASIMTEDGLIPYDMDYLITQIRKALKGTCRGYFADKMRYAGYISILERDGISGVDYVLKLIKKLFIAKDSNKNLISFTIDHLERLKMCSKINFAKPKEEKIENVKAAQPEELIPETEEDLIQPADGDSKWVQYWKDLRSFRRLSIEELEAEANDYKRYIKEKTDDNSL